MVQQLSTSASEELAAKFTARRLEAHNAKLINKIKGVLQVTFKIESDSREMGREKVRGKGGG